MKYLVVIYIYIYTGLIFCSTTFHFKATIYQKLDAVVMDHF